MVTESRHVCNAYLPSLSVYPLMLQIISRWSPPAKAIKYLSEYINNPRGFSTSMIETISASYYDLQRSEVVAINGERRSALAYRGGQVAVATHDNCAFVAAFKGYKDGETWYEYVR